MQYFWKQILINKIPFLRFLEETSKRCFSCDKPTGKVIATTNEESKLGAIFLYCFEDSCCVH